ncbi:MAG TPA: DUF2171 domain-containing protein [Gaiellaceae bacterium]|nr:DUF2171 domain-containing protein [Gaiellaceae bacterium]
MADPVSWLMIRPGWKVVASDGSEVGEVDEVTGDENVDIFDGLAIATSALGQPRYVPAESIAAIEEGRVTLALSAEEAGALAEFREPATSEEIEADSKGGLGESIGADVRDVEGHLIHPVEPERRETLVRRIVLLFRRLLSR